MEAGFCGEIEDMTAKRIMALRPAATRDVGEVEAHAVWVDNEPLIGPTRDRLTAVRPHCGALASEVGREHFAELLSLIHI